MKLSRSPRTARVFRKLPHFKKFLQFPYFRRLFSGFLEFRKSQENSFWEVLELTTHVLHVLTNLYMIAFEVSV